MGAMAILEYQAIVGRGITLAYNLPDCLYRTMVMKGWAYPLVNDRSMSVRLNAVFTTMPNIKFISGFPPAMGSEDVHHLVIDNPKQADMYIHVGAPTENFPGIAGKTAVCAAASCPEAIAVIVVVGK